MAGKIGQALGFYSTTDYLDMGDVLNFSSLPVTVSAWVKLVALPAVSGDPIFLSEVHTQGQAHAGIDLNVRPDGKLNINFGNNTICAAAGRRTKTSSGAITVGTWYHISAVVRGASNMNIYINGVDAGGSYSGSGGAITSTTRTARVGMDIDCGIGTALTLNGAIDDVRVYNRALSAAEVNQLYKLGTANAGHSNTVAISNGLVGYWTFDGSATDWRTNTTADLSGQGNTGTLVSLATTTSPVAGKIGQALKFDGTSSYVIGPSMTLTKNSFSSSAWFKTTSSADQKIISNYGGGAHPLSTISGTLRTCYANCQAGTTAINDGKWHFAVTISTGNFLYVYLDGKPTPEILLDISGEAASYSGAMTIGATAPGVSLFFNGSIDDVRVYNRALSATEAKQLFNMGR